MFIEKLIITKQTSEVIRNIDFHKGLNLIVGVSDQTGSSNNIGKTTLIRCIDFCLNGRLEQLYTDKEFKTSINQEIYDFLAKEKPTFTLVFQEPTTNYKYIVERTVDYSKEKKFQFSNQITINETNIEGDFETELKKLFFNNLEKKPTFRQLVPKFIRKDEQQISNVLRYLHSTTTNVDYEKIHLFLFGFKAKKILQQKSELEHKLKGLKKSKIALASRFTATDLKQILEITKKDLEKLYQARDKFQLDEKYEIEEQELKSLQLELIKFEKYISDYQLKKTLGVNKLKELQDGIFENDTKALELLYDEAKFYSNDLHKSFDEVVHFHNKMIQNEIQYITSKIEEYDNYLINYKSQRNDYSKRYSMLMEKLSKTGSLSEYTKLNEQIEKIAEKKGRDEKLLEELGAVEHEIKGLEDTLSKVKEELNNNLADFDTKLSIFNQSFSTYSNKLYDEEYILSYDKDDEPIKFYTKNIDGNQGSGKKQAIISAFDLAYIDFINKLKLSFPRFVAHDKVELIDIDKLKSLFVISNSVNGQYIVPIIHDKIEKLLPEFEKNIILTLSEKDKFFRI